MKGDDILTKRDFSFRGNRCSLHGVGVCSTLVLGGGSIDYSWSPMELAWGGLIFPMVMDLGVQFGSISPPCWN